MHRLGVLLVAFLLQGMAADPPSDGLVVQRGDFEKRLVFSGELQAVDSFTITVPRVSEVSNLSISYLVPEGALVQPGDLVVQFDVNDLESRRLELEKEREDARTRIAQKESELDAQKQDLLLNLANTDKDMKVAGLYAGIDETLLPRSEVDKYRFDLERSQVEVEKIRDRLATHERTRLSELEVVRLEFEKADLKLKRIESEIERLSIYAPMPGLVVYANHPQRSGKIQSGDSMWSGWPVVQLPNMEEVEILTYVYSADFRYLEEGMSSEVILDAIPGRTFRGIVGRLPEAARPRDFRSNLKAFHIPVRIVGGDTSVLKPGMSARVEVPVLRRDALMVPRAAIEVGVNGSTLARRAAEPDRSIEVEVIDVNDTMAVIRAELTPGDRLVDKALPRQQANLNQNIEWIRLDRKDLLFSINGSGLLQAETAVNIQPPALQDLWRFKIIRMAPEGIQVSSEDELVAFDPTEVQSRLREEMATLEKVEEEYEKTKASQELQIKDLQLQVEEARVQDEKAQNKLVQARQFDSSLKMREAEFEAELTTMRVNLLTRKMESVQRNFDLQQRILQEQRELYRHRIARRKAALESLNVAAPISGVVIYETNWRNEKKQIGSDVFRMESIMSIPDLSSMVVEGQVAEVDAGKIRVGQEVQVTIDAIPNETFRGRMEEIGNIFKRAAFDRPVKVLDVKVRLETIDLQRMRPGMAVRLQIIADRFEKALAVPLSVIELADEESWVWVKEPSGPVRRQVQVGENNGVVAVIEEGLEPGEEVASRPLGDTSL